MDDRELMFLPAFRQREMLLDGSISATELASAAFRRIHELDSTLHAFITVDEEGALETAAHLDRALHSGETLGRLHGIPVAVKDLEATKNLRSTFGSRFFVDWVPPHDSVMARRLRVAGAVIIGKTNTPEFGNREETFNEIAPTSRSPWDTDYTPGGSSGGTAAAIAAGMCSLGTGSDGGGSIRIPAAFTGTYGIKPSQGRVPRAGGVGNPAYNIMASSGPMSNSVRDAAIMLTAIAGGDNRDPGSLYTSYPDYTDTLEDGVAGLRIGLSLTMGYASVDEEVATAVENAARKFADMGAKVEEAPLVINAPFDSWWPVWTANQAAMYGNLYDSNSKGLAPYTRAMIEHGRTVSGAEYSQALRAIQQTRVQINDFFNRFDLLLLPTTATTAWRHQTPPQKVGGKAIPRNENVSISYYAIPFTMLFNSSGHPAASVPCGFDSNDLPIGLQIVGGFDRDALVLTASRAFEEICPWTDRKPANS